MRFRLSFVTGLRDRRNPLPLLRAAQGGKKYVAAQMENIIRAVHFAMVGLTRLGVVHASVHGLLRPLRLKAIADLETA